MSDMAAADLLGLLGLTTVALLLVEKTGRVTYANAAAQPYIRPGRMLTVRDGILAARRKAEDKVLREALAGVSPANNTAVVCLRNREGLPVAVIDMRQLESGLVAMRLAETASRPIPSPSRLRTIFGMTAAEARVASAILAGSGLTDIAHRHGVEPETVRTQSKRLRSKTGAQSLNQMLGVLLAVGGDFEPL